MSVEKLERFDFGGPPQWALVRGRSPTAPVLLFVQQGPGLPMIHDAPAIERQLHLEELFRVVYWDQRGTGRSFDSGDREPIILDTAIGDVRAMVRALCQRFAVDQVDVVGFSFGASMSLLACTEASLPVRSLTCVGVDVNLLEGERLAQAFALEEAARRGNKGALRALRAIGDPPHSDAGRFMVRARWATEFGGVHQKMGYGAMVRSNVWRLWRSPHYSLGEMVGALRGIEATAKRLLPALQGFDLLANPPRVQVPVRMFQGRHDKVAPPDLAAGLAARVGADVIWFEESAHMPYDEEPVRFREELLRFIRR